MITTTETCWADPLTRRERTELSKRLARACRRSYRESLRGCRPLLADSQNRLTLISAEMADLHLDVTERAAVPARAER